jgi:pyruvate formate lyase activating enzyme
MTLGYADPCAIHVDPIEKKPFYHVTPGARAYSLAVAGCNFRCKNCQNWTISQSSPLDTRNYDLPPQKAVEEAKRSGCTAIAYTYSEPTVWFEYMYDTCKLARAAGLKNVWVTCGYINEGPLRELAQYLDAATVDLKSFDNRIYGRLNAGSLDPILRTLTTAQKLGIWIEVSNLIVPEWSDDPGMIRAMCAWIRANLGEETPMHFLRFFPMHLLANLPPTPEGTMRAAAKIALEEKLKYVYVGNVAGADQSTYCPSCGNAVVERAGFLVTRVAVRNGTCSHCGRKLRGLWQ